MNMENADLTKKARTAPMTCGRGHSGGTFCAGRFLRLRLRTDGSGDRAVMTSLFRLVIACLVGLFGFFCPGAAGLWFCAFLPFSRRGETVILRSGPLWFPGGKRFLRATILIGVFCALVCSSGSFREFSGAFVFHDFYHDGRRIH